MSDCVFCAIVAGDSPAEVVRRWPDAMAFVPLNPVTDGHTLIVPNAHVSDASQDIWTSALTMARAAQYVVERGLYPPRRACNIITSLGDAATQTVFHLHLHVVPRTAGDGLHLPWTNL